MERDQVSAIVIENMSSVKSTAGIVGINKITIKVQE